MAMIYSEVPCNAAGTFTTNLVKAAPVKWDQEIVYHAPSAQAVIINAGIANACTGAEGYGYCRATADAAADILKIPANAVLVASTGVIGMQIPIHKIVAGVQVMSGTLDGSLESGTISARAIMTTDTVKKEAAVETVIGGKTVRLDYHRISVHANGRQKRFFICKFPITCRRNMVTGEKCFRKSFARFQL